MPNFSTGGGGTFDAPIFNASDFGNYSYSTGTGDSGTNETGWGYLGWDQGDLYDHLRLQQSGGRSSNYDLTHDNTNGANGFNLQVKSGEKAGTNIQYDLVDGQYVPRQDTTTTRWDTNSAKQNISLATLALAAAGGAFLAPAAAGAGSFATGAGMTGAGIVAEGGGGLAAGLGGASGGAVGGGYGFSQVPGSYGASLGNMSVAPGTAAAGAAPWQAIPGYGSAVSGAGGSFMDTIKEGYDYYKNAKRIQSGYNAITGGGQQGGRGSMAQGSGGFLGDLYGIGSGLYSEHQNRESGRHLEDIYNRREQERQPFVDRLNASYADGGRSYLEGEYAPLADIEGNRLARLGAKGGTNANTIGNQALLQAHAQKNLEGHRQGLRGALQAHDLTGSQKLMEEAMRRNAAEGMFMGGGMGYRGGAGGGGLLPNIINGIGGQVGGWWDDVSNWANGGVTGDAIESLPMEDWFESGIGGL
jgi:hypothetical protein